MWGLKGPDPIDVIAYSPTFNGGGWGGARERERLEWSLNDDTIVSDLKRAREELFLLSETLKLGLSLSVGERL
jgi:hypothetical protein